MNSKYDETAIEIIRYVSKHLPSEGIDHFGLLMQSLLEQHNQQLLDQLVDFRLLQEKARRLGQQRTTFFHLLRGILKDSPMSSPGVADALRPHMLTLCRFLDEHNIPEPLEHEIREE